MSNIETKRMAIASTPMPTELEIEREELLRSLPQTD
jgi:hypothetical protein